MSLSAIWASVAVVFITVAGIVTLQIFGKDPGVLLAVMGTLGIQVISGLVVHTKVGQVETKVDHLANGGGSS